LIHLVEITIVRFYVLKTIADVCSYVDWREISGEFKWLDALNIELWIDKNSESSN